MAEPRRYRGVEQHDRQASRRAALIDTALDCIEADGLQGVSVRSICARSRLTPRYFYENFTDLDDLLVATVDGVFDEIAAKVLAAVADAPDELYAQVHAGIGAGYGVVASDRRKATAVLVAAAGHGPLRERRHRFVEQYAELAMGALPALGAHTAAGRRQARGVALFLVGGSGELIEAVLSGTLRMTRAQLVDQLTGLWTAAITGPTGE